MTDDSGGSSGWGMALVIILGVLVGLGAYTFHSARGASYLSDESETCLNCHVMREHFESWTRSSHHAVAACNDCHTPHGFTGKWLVKATNGFHHSLAFTVGEYPTNLRIKESNAAVTQRACVDCHQAMVGPVHVSEGGDELSCASCHRSVGHLY